MDITTLLTVGVVAMLSGGLVKGTLGIGLPLVAIPQLSLVYSLPVAGGLLIAPTVVSNFAQSFEGGSSLIGGRLKRFGWLCVLLLIGLIAGTQILVLVPEKILYLLVGSSIVGFSSLTHFYPQIRVTEQQHRWAGPIVGVLAGVLGGMTSIYGPPLLIYLAALRLPRDEFVGVISLVYFVGATGYGIGLAGAGIADLELLTWSALACIPVFAGMWVGQRLRKRLDEKRFTNWLYVFYLIIGGSFLVRAF